ncbi:MULTISPECIES: hypothetical protein [Bacillus]|uniref:hypothetical protein n=1 Tax=Bacillus TaxID=1386 RepID=UPI00227F673A|nr:MULTISPECIES: hypothetical protein [Bacillus]MCY8755658.1 hypothetical protein [Bacillus haynesii]MEC0715382.1 hypothetical protein [Bacillus licheniformis]
MNLKKVLTCSALAGTLLVASMPAISASATSPITETKAEKTCESQQFGPYPSRNSIPNVYDDGVHKWYLKGVASWKGEWYGNYERCW